MGIWKGSAFGHPHFVVGVSPGTAVFAAESARTALFVESAALCLDPTLKRFSTVFHREFCYLARALVVS